MLEGGTGASGVLLENFCGEKRVPTVFGGVRGMNNDVKKEGRRGAGGAVSLQPGEK